VDVSNLEDGLIGLRSVFIVPAQVARASQPGESQLWAESIRRGTSPKSAVVDAARVVVWAGPFFLAIRRLLKGEGIVSIART
jgi:hypothetical protein